MCSIGLALADSIDKLIASKKISPQLANSIMVHFDKTMAQQLAEKVKTHLIMKVRDYHLGYISQKVANTIIHDERAELTLTAIATRSGHSSSRTSSLNLQTRGTSLRRCWCLVRLGSLRAIRIGRQWID